MQGPDGDELIDQRPEGHPEQRLGGRSRLQQPVLRRAARRPAPRLHVQPRRGEGGRGRRRRRERRVRALLGSGFVNVVTKSGTNEFHGERPRLLQEPDASRRRRSEPDGSSERRSSTSTSSSTGFTLGGPFVKDKLFFFTAFDDQRGRSTKQTDPNRIEPRVVDVLRDARRARTRTAPIDRTNDARVFLAKFDWQPERQEPRHAPLQLHVVRAGERHVRRRLVGPSARTRSSSDNSNAVTGTVLSTFSTAAPERVPRSSGRARTGPGRTTARTSPAAGRPLPDTAFDFGRSYRFGDAVLHPGRLLRHARCSSTTTSRTSSGKHTIKAGVEYNRVRTSTQTFRGFANGRYIFGSTDGFLNYAQNPKYVECSNGTHSETGTCPAGTTITGPVLLYLQHAGVGGLTAEQAGTQSIPQNEPAVFIQDKWQPLPNLTIQVGLRWEAQIEPDPITPADQVFFAQFIGKTVNGQEFPSDGNIPVRQDDVAAAPRHHVGPGQRRQDGRPRERRHLLRAASRASSSPRRRSTNGSLGQTIFRDSTFNGFGPRPRVPEPHPAASQTLGDAGSPGSATSSTRTSRTRGPYAAQRRLRARGREGLSASCSSTTTRTRSTSRASSTATTRSSGRPGRPASGADGNERHRHALRPSSRPATSVVQRHHARRSSKRYADNFEFQAQLHALVGQVRRRQRARPVHVPLREDHQSRRRVRLLGPRPAPPLQRLVVLWTAPGDINVNLQLLVPLGAAEVAHRDRAPTREHAAGPHQRGRLGRRSGTSGGRTTSSRPSTCASRGPSSSAP